MNTSNTKAFKRLWLDVYIDDFRKGNLKERQEIKKRFYSIRYLKESEKDILWGLIVRGVRYDFKRSKL